MTNRRVLFVLAICLRGNSRKLQFIETNIVGAQNLAKACPRTSVEDVMALSADKGEALINLYGAINLCSDKLFAAANNTSASTA